MLQVLKFPDVLIFQWREIQTWSKLSDFVLVQWLFKSLVQVVEYILVGSLQRVYLIKLS